MAPFIWPKPFQYFENVQFFLVSICLIIAAVLVAIFSFLYNQTDALLLQRVKEHAVTYVDFINHTKTWNYDYGGVYVEKKPGVESNAYLKGILNPDLHAEKGKTLTIRNHAIMIKEISRQSEFENGVRFRIISLHPLDPSNTADELEVSALRRFEKGAKEFSRVEGEEAEKPLYRYVTPLYYEKGCIECHPDAPAGNVLGAVSITVPMANMVKETDAIKRYIILAAIVTTLLLIGTTYGLTWRLVINLDAVQKRLKQQAAKDELTGLKNRRTIMARLEEEFQRAKRQGLPLSVISLDIDHFKRINDTYGHPFGDVVLKQASHRMSESLRSYDSLGRIGGEEFLLVAPGSSEAETVTLAERLLRVMRETTIGDDTTEVTVTMSAGVTVLTREDRDMEALLRRVDVALYRAKHEGRNRVVCEQVAG